MAKGFKKGYTPWNKNKKCPQISKALRGKEPVNKIGMTNICKCGKEFNVKPAEIKMGKAKYCSKKCYYKSKLGRKTWNTGTKGVMKINNKSFKKGLVPWNFKGKSLTTKLQRNKFTREVSQMVLKRDNYTCQMCAARGGDLHVDHIQSWAEYANLRFNMDNCRTLCVDCHYLVTFGKEKPKESNWGIFRKGENGYK